MYRTLKRFCPLSSNNIFMNLYIFKYPAYLRLNGSKSCIKTPYAKNKPSPMNDKLNILYDVFIIQISNFLKVAIDCYHY